MNGILLAVGLYVFGAVACIWFGMRSTSEAINTIKESTSNIMLGDGKEKSKRLEKEPAKDPMMKSREDYGNNMQMASYRIPDMRGVEYGSSNADINATGITNTFAGNNSLGVVNQSGDIKNTSLGSQEISGVINSAENMYNVGINNPGKINQQSQNMLNNISNSNVMMNSGSISKNYTVASRENTPKLKVSTGQLLGGTRHYTAPAGTLFKEKSDVQTQTTSARKIINFKTIQEGKLVANPQSYMKMLSLEQVYGNPANAELDVQQSSTFAAVLRYINENNIPTNSNYETIIKQVIKEKPELNTPEKILTATDFTIRELSNKNGERMATAKFMTNKPNAQKKVQTGNMQFLNNLIKSDSSIANQFSNFIKNSDREKYIQKAKENIQKRDNMSLEEKEQEYEEYIKSLILSNPDAAKDMIGEKGVTELKRHMKEEEDKTYNSNLERIENIEDKDFIKNNKQYKDASMEEVREARLNAEMKKAISIAVNEMYNSLKADNEKRASKIRSFEEFKQRREKTGIGMVENMPQPMGMSSIYLPKAIQDQVARQLDD